MNLNTGAHPRRIPVFALALALALTAVTQAFARPASAQGIKLYIPELHVSNSFVNHQS